MGGKFMADQGETREEGPYILHLKGKKVRNDGLNAQRVRTRAKIDAVQVFAGGEPRSVPIGKDFEVSKEDYEAFTEAELPEGYAWREPNEPEGSDEASEAGANTPGTPGEGAAQGEQAETGSGDDAGGDAVAASASSAPATGTSTGRAGRTAGTAPGGAATATSTGADGATG
jgi:hypothetical protein